MNRRRRTSSARKSRRSTTRTRARRTTSRRFSGTNKVWTRSEIATLRKIYRTNSNMDIAKKLGRSEGSVQYKASSLGLRKSASYLKQIRNNWS